MRQTKVIQHKRPWKRISLIIVLVIIAAMGVYGGLAKANSWRPFKKHVVSVETNTPVSTKPIGAAPAVDPTNTTKGSVNDTYTPPVASNNNVSLTVKKSDSSSVTVITKLVNYSDGACSLTVTNGSKTVTQNAQVVYAPDYSSCAGFSVPISSLGTGTWSISLAVTSGGVTTTKTTTYEVAND